MKKILKLAAQVARCNCGVRVNSLIVAIIPAIDAAQTTWPTLREHLPANIYSIGFVVLGIANIFMHIRLQPPALPNEPPANPPDRPCH